MVAFSGGGAVMKQQEIKYLTERAVFRLTPEEISPGVDCESQVLACRTFP